MNFMLASGANVSNNKRTHINLIGVRVRVAKRIPNKNGYVPTGTYMRLFLIKKNAAILQNTHGMELRTAIASVSSHTTKNENNKNCKRCT